MTVAYNVHPDKSLPAWQVSREQFSKAVSKMGNAVRAVRTYTSHPAQDPDGVWRQAPYIRVFYEVQVETEKGPGRYTHTESIPVEVPSGILLTAGTLWRELRDEGVRVWCDRTRSGAL